MTLLKLKVDPVELFLWTFRRNEKDVVHLYNSLSDIMRLATGNDMLNFGYWTENIKEPINAQEELCKIFGDFAELDTAKKIVDIGSGFSAPAIQWKSQFNSLKITCLNINFNQLKESSTKINSKNSSYGIYLLNSTSTSLPFPDESFDRVLALESVHHVKHLQNFFSESKRILKKQGILAIAIPVVTRKISPIVDLGILSMTWSSEHYTSDYIKSLLTNNGFDILEEKNIGSKVYEPLANYYFENRNKIKNKILSKYPSYVEKILFKSLQKMKQISEKNIIDYVLFKAK
ncbi:MAG TPA: methyltransferase domain-containing protein [Nitrosopumilaceae archaeon]|nr:methyltransferase domain-containing protein [Nitrosopumilaceae archaeon]